MLSLLEKVPIDLFSLAEIKLHLRLDHSVEDEYLKGLYEAAYELVEQYLNRCLLQKTWQLEIGQNLGNVQKITLPYAPILEILTIEQIFENKQKKPLNRFFLHNNRGVIELYSSANKVLITYNAGFGAYPNMVPGTIRQAILVLITELYENRSNFVIESHTVLQTLLHPYRIINLR